MGETRFKDLKVYQGSTELCRKIFEVVKQFPSEEKDRLGDQLIRSTRKCPANIAEGHGRYHYQENIQYCANCKGIFV